MREIKFRVWDKDEKIFLKNTECDFFTLNDMKYDDPNLFIQFTGLKDKNGVEIYEGDIVNSNYFKNGVVVFWRNGWHLNAGKDCHHSFNTSIHSFEIIGNIYENPELL